jgi:hypothetical protein
MRMLLTTLALFSLTMMSLPSPADSFVDDVIVTKDSLTCTADWRCVGDSEAAGGLRATKDFAAGEEDLCGEHLLDQVYGTGLCRNEAYELVPNTFHGTIVRREVLILTCANGYGEQLCSDLEALNDSLNWRCTGSACYDVWRSQADKMRDISRWDGRILDLGASVSPAIAERAYRVALRMCSVERTGDPTWIRHMVKMNNLAGVSLKKIQEFGDLEPAYLCKQIIQN